MEINVSISNHTGGPMQRVKSNRKNLLVDHSKEATNLLLDIAKRGGRVGEGGGGQQGSDQTSAGHSAGRGESR